VDNQYFVYILTNSNNKVLYVGFTNNLERRLHEHKDKTHKGFTQKYNVHKVVYFESTSDVLSAIEREKQIKGWVRRKKDDLIKSSNPEWCDLSLDWK
jgi:putative endonuclease